MSSIAKLFHVSVSTVLRYLDLISYPKIKVLPSYLAIDEFKGNTGGFKYNAIITDPFNHKVLDILKTRDKAYISQYFSNIPNENNVSFFIQDMWQPYKDFASLKFPNARIIADKYHYVRQVFWAVENVRKREQKRLIKDERLFFKRCKYLLYKNNKTIEEEQLLYNIALPFYKNANIPLKPNSIYIVQDNTLNAFVADGNNLFIHTGTIVSASSSNELAGVIAHEIGHIAGGHILRGKLQAEELQQVGLASLILASAAAVTSGRGDAAMAIALGGQSTMLHGYVLHYRHSLFL